jgi:glutathione S-transferase/GST-like protein
MIYLAEKTGKLLPSDPAKKSEVLQWLMFQMGGIGPMMGQANVFYRYFPEKLQSVIDRYQNESKRLFTVIDKHLESNQYLAQDFSIADIANWSWIRIHKWSGVEIEDLPNLKRWMDEINLRPACIKGVQIPRALELPDDENSEKIKEFEKNAKKILQK